MEEASAALILSVGGHNIFGYKMMLPRRVAPLLPSVIGGALLHAQAVMHSAHLEREFQVD